jgi:hypothetical protein
MKPWIQVVCTVAMGVAVLISQRHSAYLQRKLQIRIEKHKLDPSFPIEEPPGKFKIFFKKYGADICGVILNGFLLSYWLTRPRPVGHTEVAMVAFLISMTVAGLYYSATLRAQGRILDVMGIMSSVDRSSLEQMRDLGEEVLRLNRQAAQLTGIVEEIAKRIGDGEK